MKAEFDQEIDSLLRKGARRGLAAPSERGAGARGRAAEGGARATPSGAHLDADEQNAYAENSLPPSARTHYASHLAECDDCRRSVTRLALAAGMPAQLEQSAATVQGVTLNAASPGVTWRERLGALFAPRAWRYAVPALALLLVGAVALLVLLRERRSEVSVAEQQPNKSEQARPSIAEMNHTEESANHAAPGVVSGAGDAQPAPNSNASSAREAVAAVAREDEGQAKAGATLSDTATTSPSSSGAGSAPVAAAEMPLPTPMPTPTPIPELTINSSQPEPKKASERSEETAKDVQQPGDYETRQQRDPLSGPRRNEQSRNIQRSREADIARDDADKNDAALAKTAPAPPATATRRAKPREADGERDGKSSDDSVKSESLRLPKSSAETRTVAGRKFRRAGGAWIDTAYQSSQAVTSIKRNSEQYRALVADEPELRRISDALGGEVTVVWKGRAYRFK